MNVERKDISPENVLKRGETEETEVIEVKDLHMEVTEGIDLKEVTEIERTEDPPNVITVNKPDTCHENAPNKDNKEPTEVIEVIEEGTEDLNITTIVIKEAQNAITVKEPDIWLENVLKKESKELKIQEIVSIAKNQDTSQEIVLKAKTTEQRDKSNVSNATKKDTCQEHAQVNYFFILD
jgi:hypothetical protein